MSGARGSLLLGAALALAGASAGWLVRGAGPATAPDADRAVLETLHAELAGLRAELRAAFERVEQLESRHASVSAPGATPERAPVNEAPAARPDLEARLDELTRRIETALGNAASARSASLAPAPADARHPPFADMRDATSEWQRAFEADDTPRGDGALAEFYERLRRAHFFWRIDDIVGRYGTPDAVQSDVNGLGLRYAISGPNGEPFAITFTISNGRVVDCALGK